MTNNFPKKEDQLFIEEKSPAGGAWLKNPTNKFFLYSEGYKEAGNELFKFCIKGTLYRNLLIYPLIFVYRQFLELRLKELIIMGYDYIPEAKDFPDEHNLDNLWKLYRHDILSKIESIDKDILDNVENVILQFHNEDPKSMSFRYPVTKAPNRQETITRDTIDLVNFKEVMDKLIYFLDYQWEMISHYKDLKAELLSEMYSEYWR